VSVLELKGVTKTYHIGDRELPILRGIDMRIDAGEFVAIVGPSGSGKSTLLHLMGALDKPSTGTVSIAGHNVASLDDAELAALRNQTIGFVFQSFYLLSYYTALENVCLPLIYAGTYAEKHELAEKLLHQVGLGERMSHRPNEMSGGERQRVAIARAFINQPSIIYADEPTGNLDSQNGAIVMQFLREINRQGTTVVLITHDAQVAAQARRLVRIQDGIIA
jgi:putative ABC transport system ATP-binding protein